MSTSDGKQIVVIDGSKGSNKGGRESSDTLRSKSVARVLDMLSEGPIKGFVSDKQSIYINEVAWAREDGVENFQGLSVDLRYGDTSQDPIEGFPSVEREIGDGREMTFGNVAGTSKIQPEIQINDNLVDAVRVTIQVPALAFTDKKGNIDGNNVQIQLEVKNALTAYVVAVTDTISGKTTAPYERSYRIELPKDPSDPSGNLGFPCKIRATRLTADSTQLKSQNTTILSHYTEIIDHKLSYPDTAYVGMTFDSELFKDGVPSRLFHIDGLKMAIPSNYYPMGMAIENLVPLSEDFTSNTVWGKSGMNTINVADNITAPDGTLSAQVLAPTSTSNVKNLFLNNFLSGTFAGIDYCHSVYVKQLNAAVPVMRFEVYSSASTNSMFLDLNFSTGLVTPGNFNLAANNGRIVNYGSENVGDGWYRIWIAGYPSATVPTIRPALWPLNSANSSTWAGNNTAYFAAWGFQSHPGKTPYQYLKNTTTSKATGTSNERYYYGTWDGTFKVEWTNNPAWVVYMLLTHPRIGMGQWVNEALVDKWALYSLSKYCDELVPDGFGSYEPRFAFNGVIRNREDAYTVLQNIASVFRGIIYWGAGSTLVSWDAPKDASILVTPSNVIDGLFDYKGVGWKARHSAVLVKWNDPSNLYKDAVEVIEDQDLILKYGWKPLETTALGCTSRGQAYRWGKWILYTEKYETETVVYRASFDHMVKDGTAVMPGDIIKIADPSYAGVRNGGRIARVVRNHLLYGNQFNSWSPFNVTVTPNALTRQSILFDQIVETNAANTEHIAYQNYLTPSAFLTPGETYNYSVYLTRPATNAVNRVYLLVVHPEVWTTNCSVIVDLATGNYQMTGDPTVMSNIKVALVGGSGQDAVWRASFDFIDRGNTGTYTQIRVQAVSDANQTTYPGASKSFYAAQAQISTGSGVLEYMDTTAAARQAVIVDSPVTLNSGTVYTLSAVLPDGKVEERTIVSPPGERTLIQLATPFSADPIENAMWVISSSEVEPRTFRVLSVREQEKNIVEVTALYHNANKFAMVEQDLKFETPNFSVLDLKSLTPPSNFTYDEYLFLTVGNSIQTGLLLSWSAPVDGRVTFFDIEYKPPNEDWRYLTSTSSVNTSIECLNQGLYSFRIRSTGSIGNNSQWQTLDNVQLYGLSQKPPEVVNFNMNAVGDQAYLTWDTVDDPTIGSFIIKIENTVIDAQWGSGITVLDNIPRTANHIFVPLRFGTYMIKTVSVAGVESATATYVISDIAGIQNFNAFENVQAHPTFAGTKTNLAVVNSALVTTATDGLYAAEGIYQLASVVDLGEVYTNRLTPTIVASGQRASYTMATWGVLTQVDRLDGGVEGSWSVIIEYSSTKSDPATATDWTDWRTLVVGDSTARGYRFRLRLLSSDTSVQVRVSQFSVVVDMPDRVEGKQGVAVPALSEGLAVVYDNAFKTVPAAAVTIQNAQVSDVVTLSNETRTGFTIKITNGGSPVARTVNWLAKGYGK